MRAGAAYEQVSSVDGDDVHVRDYAMHSAV
jgi:hypothetical protein